MNAVRESRPSRLRVMSAESSSASWSTYLGMGAVTGALIVIGLLLGLGVDSLVGTAPVFLFVGLVVGVVAAIAYTVSKFREMLSR